MPIWRTDLPDNPEFSYTPTRDPGSCPHEGTWRTIHCDGERDIIRCDKCGARADVKCNFDEDFA